MSSTHSTTEASSSIRFSIGVPVSTSRYVGVSPLTESAVFVCQFLIRCASSSTTSSGFQRADDVEVAEELLIIDDEKALLARRVQGLAGIGRTVHDLDGEVGEHRPFSGPLRLEAGGRDDEPASDPPAPPEDVARGDRLRGLAQAHIVGQEEPTGGQEPSDAFALIGVERAFQAPKSVADLGRGRRLLDDQLESMALVDEQGAKRRIMSTARRSGRDRSQQIDDQLEAALGRSQ